MGRILAFTVVIALAVTGCREKPLPDPTIQAAEFCSTLEGAASRAELAASHSHDSITPESTAATLRADAVALRAASLRARALHLDGVADAASALSDAVQAYASDVTSGIANTDPRTLIRVAQVGPAVARACLLATADK